MAYHHPLCCARGTSGRQSYPGVHLFGFPDLAGVGTGSVDLVRNVAEVARGSAALWLDWLAALVSLGATLGLVRLAGLAFLGGPLEPARLAELAFAFCFSSLAVRFASS